MDAATVCLKDQPSCSNLSAFMMNLEIRSWLKCLTL